MEINEIKEKFKEEGNEGGKIINFEGEKWLSLPWTESLNPNHGTIGADEKLPPGKIRIAYHCPKCEKLKARYEDKVWSCGNCGFEEDVSKWGWRPWT